MAKKEMTLPESSQLESEIKRVRFKSRYFKLLASTVGVLIVVAAVSVLIATLVLPVLEIYGNSMTPTLTEGNIVVSVKKGSYDRGDIIAYYYNNRILVKRIIALPGDSVTINDSGTVSLNGKELEEDYIETKVLGECDIALPFKVPDGTYFVMGDNRESSIDSRTQAVGCTAEDEIIGSVFFTVWPLNHFGIVR